MWRPWIVIGGFSCGFAAFVATIAALWLYFLTHSSFYAASLEFVHDHPEVRELIGEVRATARLPIGFYLESVADHTGEGGILLRVHGANGSGWVVLTAYRRFAHWVVERARWYRHGVRQTLATVDSLLGAMETLAPAQLEAHARQAMAIQPKIPEPHYALGQQYLDAREYPRAEAALREAIARDATFAPAYNDLGVAHMDQGRYAEALPLLERAGVLDPTDPLPLINQARIFATIEARRDLPKARTLLEAAAERDPSEATIYELLAEIHGREGNPTAAAAADQRARALRQEQAERLQEELR